MERSHEYDCVEERARLPRILFYVSIVSLVLDLAKTMD